MKKNLLRITACFLTLAIIVCAFASCSKDGNSKKVAIEIKDSEGKTVSTIDQKLLSLIMAVTNFNLGTSNLEEDMWDMTFQEGNDTTVKQIVVAQSTAYAKGLLQAEYLCDVAYEIGLSDKQKDSIETYISDLSASYGSEKNFENALSVYGADVASFKRFMELMLKQSTMYESFYAEGGYRRDAVELAKPEYFEENYVIADHILLKYSAGTRADGVDIPVSEEEKAAIRERAKTLYQEIITGVRDFDEALTEFSEDTYKLGFPYGYFHPVFYYQDVISQDVQDAARKMTVGEIRFVDTEAGAYIVRKNEMDPTLYSSNGDFELSIESVIAQEDFLSLCETAGEVAVNDTIVNELNPAHIPPLNIDALGQ
ncbi:MAG: peptidylprolyl isomerase [Clostridia bacterium]|nr:peptidylprolyl isomerase [Clostridia bacterium]